MKKEEEEEGRRDPGRGREKEGTRRRVKGEELHKCVQNFPQVFR